MKKRDLTTGSVYSNLIYMALPTMFGFFAQTLFNVVDMFYVGMISPEAVAGVTIYSTISVIIYVFNDIIGTSSISLISQSYGQGDLNKTARVVEQTITFKGLIALVAGAFMLLFLEPLTRFFTDDPTTFKAAMDYGYIRTFFLPIMFSSYTVNTAMRCIGDSKKPLYLMIVVSVLNIVLDPILMFDTIPYVTFFGSPIPGFGMGVFGAALATVISSVVAFLIAFWILLTGKTYVTIEWRKLFVLDKEIDKKLITIGLPSGFEGLNRNLANFILFKLIAFYGTPYVAAYGIVIRLVDLCFMPLMGLNMGGSSIVGQNLGAENLDRAKKTIHASARLGVGVMILISIGSFLYAEEMVSWFIKDLAVIEIGATIVKWLIPSMILLAMLFGYGTAFSGSGYNTPFFIASVVSRWAVLIPIGLFTTYFLKGGFTGLLVAYILSELVDMAVILFYYRNGSWQSRRI